jgi:hypothetical protein
MNQNNNQFDLNTIINKLPNIASNIANNVVNNLKNNNNGLVTTNTITDNIANNLKEEIIKSLTSSLVNMSLTPQAQDYQSEKESTKRYQIDMTKDNWLSKNIRPLTLIYLMILFTLGFFRDVPQHTLEVLHTLLLTAFSFYFGARTLEKITMMLINKK